jgi:RNA polymerase sigma-70 factor (ECF subfamily)
VRAHSLLDPTVVMPVRGDADLKQQLAAVYHAYFHQVERWARALGGPQADLEDIAQEVFVVVGRQLHRFDGHNLPGWLYRITVRTVSDQRRRAWFRRLFRGASPPHLDRLPAEGADPSEQLERREAERRLYRILDRLSEKRRRAFILFEIEGRTGEEIAALEGIPLATVWTRLHHARKEFLELVQAARKESP